MTTSGDGAALRGRRWLDATALALSLLGFAMSRGYDAVVARASFVVLDVYLGVAMTLVHIGFVLALGMLVAPWFRRSTTPLRPGLPLAAIVLAVLTFVWVP